MWRAAACAALLGGSVAAEAAVVVSPGPDRVAVTVYRDPARGQGGEMNLRFLRGFALVTETRTITVPAGESDIRLEGVAGGIVPVSAIVTGLPGGVTQKIRDARLLSPAALIDGSMGKRVTIRRTNRQTGRVTEEEAILRSGPGWGVVIETVAGVEALGCAGLPEKPVYDGVPEGLSAQPTLSVRTRSDAPATATVTVSYLASEFDWQANYVARMAPDGRTIDLFAWLTLANGNDESFAQAETQAVAGTLNRVAVRNLEQSAPHRGLSLQCWPLGTTSDVGFYDPTAGPPPPPPPPPPMAAPMAMAESIVVTAKARGVALQAVQEELGDLKLYRIPERVTVAANASKQVALLERERVPVDRIHLFEVGTGDIADQKAQIILRTKNVTARQLGLPLPSGGVALFGVRGDSELLLAQGNISDTAIGEEVEIEGGVSAPVRAVQVMDTAKQRLLTLSNALPEPVTVEVRIGALAGAVRPVGVKLARKDGRPLWRVTVPANGTAQLRYGVIEPN